MSLTRRVPRVDDRRVLSGIVYLIGNGLQQKKRTGQTHLYPKKGFYRHIEHTKSGLNSKRYVVYGAQGQPVQRHLISDFKATDVLLTASQKRWKKFVGNGAMSATESDVHLQNKASERVIPPKKNPTQSHLAA